MPVTMAVSTPRERRGARGSPLLGSETTRLLTERFLAGPHPNAPRPPELDRLTERELEVLKLVTTGASNAEIAAVRHVPGQILRVHDVAATRDFLAVLDAVAGRVDVPDDLVLPDHLRHEP